MNAHRLTAPVPALSIGLACLTGCYTGSHDHYKNYEPTSGGTGAGSILGDTQTSTTSTTIVGPGVGDGVGWIIGNEADQSQAQSRTKVSQDELEPFANTRWRLVSVDPQPAQPIKGATLRFDNSGVAVTTRSLTNGTFDTGNEYYRVAGDTLIFNKPGYVVNSRFRIEGTKLILQSGDRTATFERD